LERLFVEMIENAYLLTPRASRLATSLEILRILHFMEPEGSLPHTQVPATCLDPEPAQPRPYHHIPLPEDPS
jgi:hypothetical protein